MRGNDKVLKDLSESLKAELTAINQYFLHAKMCENWGYFRLGAYYRKDWLSVSPPAVAMALRRLKRDGFVRVQRGRVRLTAAGRQIARRLSLRYHLIERM